jgi:two-component system phosphate regulon sensor histidine kinase PhoR
VFMLAPRFFWNLYLGYIALILLTTATIAGLLSRQLEEDYLADTERLLTDKAALLREAAASAFAPDTEVPPTAAPSADALLTNLRRITTRLGRETGTRYTIIASDGTVLADSEEDPDRMDLHDRRPEVAAARVHGSGMARRYSDTLETHMMYVALPVPENGATLGFVRAALPLSTIDQRLGRLRAVAVLGAALAGVAALLIGFLVGRRLTKPLTEMAAVASSMADGNYHERLEIRHRDEVGLLAQSLNRLADQSQRRIAEITDDRNKLQAILASMVEGVIAVDREERVIHLNSVAKRILHVGSSDHLGRPIWEVTRLHEVSEIIHETLRTGVERSAEFRRPVQSQDRIVELYSSPIRVGQDQMGGAVLVLHDVTELRRLESVRRDFVANVSHELKSPLTVIRGLVETLLDDSALPTTTRASFLEKIRRQAERLRSIVSDLLTLSRAESGLPGMRRERIDWRDPVEESFRAFSPALEAKRIAARVDLPAGPVPVHADGDSLRLLLDNLLDNAVKYTPVGGEIVVRLRTEHEVAVLEVRDSGIGIEPKDQQRVFERFYRVDKARSRALGGTGLGLSIVKHLALAHGGEVGLESDPGRGSTFRVQLPLEGSDTEDSA